MPPIINYTNRDFESIKKSAIDYAKQYYPNTFKDFSEASFGAIMIDVLALIGDNLSFYLDYQANEQFLATAQQYDNIAKLARERGYRDTGKFAAQGYIDLYIIVPANSNNQPDTDYMPILQKNSSFSVKGSNANYLLTEDVDFRIHTNKTVVAAVSDDGLPTFFALKARGKVASGNLYIQRSTVGNFQNFQKIKIENPLLSEVVSVIDSNGNEYYQVDYLSQNCVFKYIRNIESTENVAGYKLNKIYVPRRFVIEEMDGYYYLVFGNGSTDSVIDPRNVVLNFAAREYTSENRIDPKNIIESDKFGIAPTNTTLNIVYRANNVLNIAASVGGLSKVVSSRFKFETTGLNESTKANVISSLEVENSEPIAGVNSTLTAEELRTRAFDAYSAQYRAVTKEDYIHMCYQLDPKYGSIKRANIFQDLNSFKRNLNLYVIGEDDLGNLSVSNDVVKQNLRKWIENYKMFNDTIDILDANIINFGIEFIVDTSAEYKELVLVKCINKLKQEFQSKLNIGENLSIGRIYKVLNSIPDVIDTKKVKIVILNTTGYASSNFDIYSNLSADSSYVICPDNAIFELKYPDTDIKGTVI